MKKQSQLIGTDTDYALRMLLYLMTRRNTGSVPASIISETQNVPLEFAYKILRKLVRAGLIRSTSGQKGGFALAMEPEQLSLLTVMESVQGPLSVRSCLMDDAFCPSKTSCPVSAQLKILQDGLRQSLQDVTLDRIAGARKGKNQDINQAENLPLVDELGSDMKNSDGTTITMSKAEIHGHPGLRHRAVSVFLFNSDRQLLIQRRASRKDVSPGLWSNTCCTHPRMNESPLDAGNRCLEFEMGIRSCCLIPLTTIAYHLPVGNDRYENEWNHIYYGWFDGEPATNSSEVSDWKFIDPNELRREFKLSPEQYSAWFISIFEDVLAEIDRKELERIGRPGFKD
jgi:isopentenyl-diphosphate delta-isomerase